MSDVRTYTGIPPASAFAARGGTSIVVDVTTGDLYVLMANGAVQKTGSAGGSSGGTATELRIDGGTASTTFAGYVLRMDFGAGGAGINPGGTP